MKNVLICSIDNENLKNFEPLISKGKDNLNFTFFDLSNIHKNHIQYKDSKIKKIRSGITLTKPFYLYNSFQKILICYLFKREIKEIIGQYDIVICGRVGILEYILIKFLKKKYGTKAFSINDSILIYHEQSSLFKKIRLAVYGFNIRQNICDKVFVSGEISKNTLLLDGVIDEKIQVTGLPRFKMYFENERENNQNKNVLILTGAHQWNGYKNWQKDQDSFLNKISNLNFNNYEINIKPHPRDTFDFSTLKKINILPKDMNIDKAIMENDIVMCATSLSTAMIQAGLLGKKTLFVKSQNLSYIMDSFNYYINKFPSENISTLNNNSLLKAKKNDMSFLDMYISKKSLYSSQIIINEIQK